MSETPFKTRLVLISGPSGAGRSTAIRVLEDLGFEAIDNLPISLIPRLLDGAALPRPLALGLDVRNRDFSTAAVIELVDRLSRDPDVNVELLYLDASFDALVRRFSETRRRHPLSATDAPAMGIRHEFDMLSEIRDRADVLIDTSALSPHDLRAELAKWFAPPSGAPMALSVQSFSYKRGLPRGADMVFDCRFLANPHWVAGLREHDGRHPAVDAHVKADPRFADFFEKVYDLTLSLLDSFVDEGKTSLTIAFGCTGGKHRSVAVAENLSDALIARGWQIARRHREIERRSMTQRVSEQD